MKDIFKSLSVRNSTSNPMGIFIYKNMKTKKEKTFKCDGCGKEKPIKEKFKVYDENYRLQKGIFECAKCKGL